MQFEVDLTFFGFLVPCLQPEELIHLDAFRRGDMGVAIAEAYYKLDELLDTDEGRAELKILAGHNHGPKQQG